MAKYNLKLTGYVGGYDFNRRDVAQCLEQNADNDVAVLVDSTGGDLATGLSIAADFRNHGAVTAHFVGFNASAATIAALGASTVTMDRNAMFLVHKCSNTVFAWRNMNADQLDAFIASLAKNKLDLDKIDENIAAFYAVRCKKPVDELLNLMKEEKWLNAKEALEWGFIDKITDYPEDIAPRISNDLAADFTAAGIPLPGKVAENSDDSGFASILGSIKKFFSAGHGAKLPEDKAQEPEQKEEKAPTETKNEKKAEEPKNKKIVEQPKKSASTSGFSDFCSTTTSAKELFDSLP